MNPGIPDSRIDAIVHKVRGLSAQQAREFLDQMRASEPDLYDEVLLALDPPTAAPDGDRTTDRVRRAVFTVTAGPYSGSTFTCSGSETYTFGRSRETRHSFPNDRAMSSLHFMFSLQPGMCLLTDIASTWGTFVNGTRVDMTEVNDGDEIKAGNTTFRLLLEGGGPPRPAVPEDARTLRQCPPGYELLGELGRGGMGVVYKVRRVSDGLTCALKLIHPEWVPSEDAVRRFRREVRVLQRLRHPHVVRFLDEGELDGRPYLVMEYVGGGSLSDVLKTGGPLPVGRAVTLVCQVLEGLAHAHGEGVVHRDVKPGNFLLEEQDGREVAKLADFGLARSAQASGLIRLTKTGQQSGTVAFMPREQMMDFRSVTAAGDQYSVAASLYQLLTGQFIFEGITTAADLLLKLMNREPAKRIDERRPELPAGLADAIHRALSHEPEERFADVTVFRQALLPFGEA